MTFDSALSQHAFSLAVATDAEHGGKKAAMWCWMKCAAPSARIR